MSLAQKTYSVMQARSPGLPYRKPRRTWAGRGSGAVCDVCGETIDADQIEYEVELPADHSNTVLNMHLSCFEEWTASGTDA